MFLAVGEGGTILQSGLLVPDRPALGPITLFSSGTVQVSLSGSPGWTYSIQASTNLTDWLNITNLALTNTCGQFVDPAATNFPQRFYRAVVQ